MGLALAERDRCDVWEIGLMTTAYTFCRGDTIALALQCVSGDPTMVSSVRAQIRSAFPPNAIGQYGAPPSAPASIAFVPAADTALAYWLVVIAAANVANLASGNYAIDAELKVSGITFTTQVAMISLQEPSTEPPQATPVTGAAWENPNVTPPSGTLSLQWGNDMDASAYIFPAGNFTFDPNIISVLGSSF